MPGAPDLPSYISGRINTPNPNNSLGAKGIGESGSVGTPPAVMNAVVDAVRHLGVTHIDMPATPLEIFNKENRSKPALINPGDKVKFNKITKEEYDKIKR